MKMCAYLSLLHLGKDFQLEILMSGILAHQYVYEQTDGTELGDADNILKLFPWRVFTKWTNKVQVKRNWLLHFKAMLNARIRSKTTYFFLTVRKMWIF
jgi:hypothetical protein